MELSQETQEKIAQLQLFEQKMHSFLTQKQTFQSQLLEVENAEKELKTATGQVFKIVGNVMLSTEKNKLEESLKERKDVLQLRVSSIEKQEKRVKEQAEEMQAQVMAEIETRMKKEENGNPN